ncbi:MAG TPA: VTT domain-containing protein [Terriglobales bacterium]|jgi:membrane protein YqaA with SNARE-associated domain|nr:VTT domain-containing protein [Terriglobales bacterium]
MLASVLVSALGWFRRFGGPGLVAIGIADGSVIPMPGSVDVLTIILAASQRDWWPYYAAMATVGSVAGGYLTYRLGRTGGKEGLKKRLSRKPFEQVRRAFEKGGFGAIFVPALLPPPVPMVPFVLAAGAANYSPKKFLLALTLGRAIRYSVMALLASIYGRHILRLLREYRQPMLWSFITLVVVASLGVAGYYFWRKRTSHGDRQESKAAD